MTSESKIDSYRDLHVWQKAMDLIVDRLKYLPMSEIESSLGICDEVGKMLTRLTQSLRGGRG